MTLRIALSVLLLFFAWPARANPLAPPGSALSVDFSQLPPGWLKKLPLLPGQHFPPGLEQKLDDEDEGHPGHPEDDEAEDEDDDGGDHAVPEPEALWLVGFGLLGMAMVGRRVR